MTKGNKLLVAAAAENLVGVHYLQLNAHRLGKLIPVITKGQRSCLFLDVDV